MNFPLNFDDVQANLREIYAALHAKPDGGALPLYAYGPPFKTQIVYQGSLAGRVIEAWDKAWHSFQSTQNPHHLNSALKLILNTVFNNAVHQAYDGRQSRLWDQMRQIEMLWNRNPTDLENAEQRKRYAQHLSRELHGSVEGDGYYLLSFDRRRTVPCTDQEVQQHRLMVINFHQATFVFWKIFVNDEHQKLRQPLLPYLEKAATLIDKPLFTAMVKEGRWIHVEGVMQRPIPVALFFKIA